MSKFHRLAPTPGIPWWERQPNESPAAYSRFLAYREMDKGNRSLRILSETTGAKINTVRQQASAYKWTDRAAAWDNEQARLRQEKLNDQQIKLSRMAMETALASTGLIARSLKFLADTGEPIPAELLPRFATMVDTLRKIAVDGPDHKLEISGPQGGPIQLAEFEGLTATQRRERAAEMAQGVLRLYQGGAA